MQIFDEIKARGVEDIFFLSMDGVSGSQGYFASSQRPFNPQLH